MLIIVSPALPQLRIIGEVSQQLFDFPGAGCIFSQTGTLKTYWFKQ